MEKLQIRSEHDVHESIHGRDSLLQQIYGLHGISGLQHEAQTEEDRGRDDAKVASGLPGREEGGGHRRKDGSSGRRRCQPEQSTGAAAA